MHCGDEGARAMSADRERRAARLREMMQPPERQKWFEGKEFTANWVPQRFALWENVLRSRAAEALDILEIGSFEGRSAIFWLEFFPRAKLTCIDHFFSKRHNATEVEQRFDANLAPYAARLTKIKSKSVPALAKLAEEARGFDLIYVDGTHQRDGVLVDSLLAWPLVRAQGIVIFDDYLHELGRNPLERPKDAIDCFLKLHEGEFEELSRGYQVIVRKK
jgi:predicted O-methyltransferase YrrM